MPKILKISFLLFSLAVFAIFLHQEAEAAPCANIPLGGTTTISVSCQLAGQVNGAEEGPLIIEAGATLTINGGMTVVWNPTFAVYIQGKLFIDKGEGAGGGQLRKTRIWYIDANNDNFPDSLVAYAADTQAEAETLANAPEGRAKRRSDADFKSNWTNVDQMTIVNSATGKSCSDYCIEKGASSCSSIGLNTDGNDGKYQGLDATYQTTCTQYTGGGCSTVMTAKTIICSSRYTYWTHCLCSQQ